MCYNTQILHISERSKKMGKKEYVEQYVEVLENALKGLFDESRESEILAADKAALGDDYEPFEKTNTAA